MYAYFLGMSSIPLTICVDQKELLCRRLISEDNPNVLQTAVDVRYLFNSISEDWFMINVCPSPPSPTICEYEWWGLDLDHVCPFPPPLTRGICEDEWWGLNYDWCIPFPSPLTRGICDDELWGLDQDWCMPLPSPSGEKDLWGPVMSCRLEYWCGSCSVSTK